MKKRLFCIIMIFVLIGTTACGTGRERTRRSRKNTEDNEIYNEDNEDGFSYDEDMENNSDKEDRDSRASLLKGSSKTLIAEPISDSSSSGSEDTSKIQSLWKYGNGAFSYDEPSDIGNCLSWKISSLKEDYEIVDAYVNFICSENKDLKLIDKYYNEYDNDLSYSYAIDYVGPKKVEGNNEMQYKKGVTCDISIWGSTDFSHINTHIYVPKSLEVTDLGYRYDSSKEDMSAGGESAYAGLYRLSDGSFETSDGRLKTKPGKSLVLRDGTEYTVDTVYSFENGECLEAIRAEDFYRTETLSFSAPKNQIMTGDMFTLQDLERAPKGVLNPSDYREDFIYVNKETTFSMDHGGDWITPLIGDKSEFEDLTVRVMYYDKGKEAVLYIYAELNSEPYTIEALCAADLSKVRSESSSGGSGSGSSSYSSDDDDDDSFGHKDCPDCDGGMRDCDICGGTGYVSSYSSTPNYSGSLSHSNSSVRDCPGALCNNGKVRCSTCNGKGWI